MDQPLQVTNRRANRAVKRLQIPSLYNGRTAWLVFLLLLIGWSLLQTGIFRQDLINHGGWSLVMRFLRAALNPDLSLSFLSLTARATLTTLAFAVLATVLSLLAGSVVALLISEVWWESVFPGKRKMAWLYHFPWLSTRSFLAFPRGIHELLWGLFFVNIFGLDPLSAVLAIVIPYTAIIAKIFAEIIDEAPRRPYLIVLNSGIKPLPAFFYTLLPRVFPDLLSYAFYRFECAVRAAAVMGIIGLGGLGYQILISFQTLNYNEMWTLFMALFLLCGVADFWSGWLRSRLNRLATVRGTAKERSPVHSRNALPDPVSQAPAATQLAPERPVPAGARSPGIVPVGREPLGQASLPRRNVALNASLLLIALLFPLSFWYVQPDMTKLWSPRTAALLSYVIDASWPLHAPWPHIVELFRLSALTLAMSVLATLVASVGGLLLAFPAANNFLLPGGIMDNGSKSKVRWLWGTAVLVSVRGFLLIARAIPAPVWALLLLFVLFPGILPGAIALGIFNLGVIGRLMAEVVEGMDDRPLRALKAQGASGLQVFLYGVLPLTMPRFIGYSLYRWEIATRATVIVGLVGAGGLGRLLTAQLTRFDYRAAALSLIFYVGLTFLVDVISTSMRRAFR
jgi:phosphonate transport system permease protein